MSTLRASWSYIVALALILCLRVQTEKIKRYTKGYGKITSFSDDQFNPDADKRANHSGSSRRGWRVCSAAHHKVAERPRVPACLAALDISRTWSPNLVHSNIFLLLLPSRLKQFELDVFRCGRRCWLVQR